MKKNIFSLLSNGALIVGAVLGGYAFVNIYVLSSRLPAGVCPVTSNRQLMYAAIVFCGVSFILSLFESKTK